MTLVCGTAGFDGTQFKGLLASRYNIQLNKTSRNSVLLQSNINNTRSDVAHLIRVLVEICSEIEERLQEGGANAARPSTARVKSLMTDVPDLPNFSRFHDAFRERCRHQHHRRRHAQRRSSRPTMRAGLRIYSAQQSRDRQAAEEGPDLVSANFVIPYPPGFPIMVPGQVMTPETIDFMRKLDVKEIHGYEQRGAEAAAAGDAWPSGEAQPARRSQAANQGDTTHGKLLRVAGAAIPSSCCS